MNLPKQQLIFEQTTFHQKFWTFWLCVDPLAVNTCIMWKLEINDILLVFLGHELQRLWNYFKISPVCSGSNHQRHLHTWADNTNYKRCRENSTHELQRVPTNSTN